jgi:hypothetical protein
MENIDTEKKKRVGRNPLAVGFQRFLLKRLEESFPEKSCEQGRSHHMVSAGVFLDGNAAIARQVSCKALKKCGEFSRV